MLNHKGEVAECTGDNIFLVKRRRCLHAADRRRHSRRDHARRRDRTGARSAASRCARLPLTRHDVYIADECFLTGTRGRSDSGGEGRQPHDRRWLGREDYARLEGAISQARPDMSAETVRTDSYSRRLARAAWRGFAFGAIATIVVSLAMVLAFGPFALLGVVFAWPLGGATGAMLFAGAAAISVSPKKVNDGPWGEPSPEQTPPKSDAVRSELLRRLTHRDDAGDQ